MYWSASFSPFPPSRVVDPLSSLTHPRVVSCSSSPTSNPTNDIHPHHARRQPKDPELPEYKGGQLGSFRRGLQSMPLAVAQALGKDRVRTGYKLRSVEQAKDGAGYIARFDTPKGRRRVRCKALAVTAPAHVVNKLLRPLVPEVNPS